MSFHTKEKDLCYLNIKEESTEQSWRGVGGRRRGMKAEETSLFFSSDAGEELEPGFQTRYVGQPTCCAFLNLSVSVG